MNVKELSSCNYPIGKQLEQQYKKQLRSTAASTTASTAASTTASTAASTTASTAASTTASTAASTTASTAASTTVSTAASTAASKLFFINFRGRSKKEKNIDKEVLYKQIEDSYDKSFSESGIKQEFRPNLEIQYKDEIYIIDSKGNVEIKKVTPEEEWNQLDLAYYNSDRNAVRFYAEQYVNGTCRSIDETLSHELYHAKEAILRNSIPQQDRNELVKEILTEHIKNGEAHTIIKSYDGKEYRTMISPVMSHKMSKQYADFAQRQLFDDKGELLAKLEEYYDVKYENKNPNNNVRLKELENELKDVLGELKTIQKNNRDYKPQNHHSLRFWKNKEEKEKELLSYTISVESRYQEFRKKEINIPENPSYNKEEVKKSINSNMNAVEGNVALENARKRLAASTSFERNKAKADENKTFLQYYYSEEELIARKEGYTRRLDELKQQREKGNFINKIRTTREILDVRRAIFLEELNYENYKVMQELRNNPNNLGLRLKHKYTSFLVNINTDFKGTIKSYSPKNPKELLLITL